ncbi:MAG TPA: GNAT family N-acetyltransferase [Planctomycetota bacterium]|nr:GNAT family N-acetyltransferase [Planctomycetota bacterium]
MQLELRPITTLDAARGLGPRLDAAAAAFQAQFSDETYPAGSAERFLERALGEPETVLLGAYKPGTETPSGLCLIGAHVDTLSGERIPMVLVLHVDDELRHRGVARGLVERARALLEARGIKRLAARALHNDDALISMGERWGFVRAWEWMLYE